MAAEGAKTTKEEKKILFGLDTFGDIPVDKDGKKFTHAAAIRQVVEEAILADKLGVDSIGVGEHHREDFSISSPETVLAGIATRTKNIKLATAVTVLSSDDPVRVFERFATLDALSNGRAQVILGRGSFTESFPLFGYDLRDYNELFEEKVELFHKLLDEKPVTWEGETRAALKDADVFPKTESGRLDVAIGVGGSPESVIRAARYGFQIVFAIIGGAPERFAPYVELYRHAAEDLGTPVLPIGVHSPGFIAETDEEAMEMAWSNFKTLWDAVGKSRGWPPYSYDQFKYEVAEGSLYVGSPETVAQKIVKTIKTLGAERFDMVYGGGNVPADVRLKMVELYGKEVIPRVRELLKES
ncbi:LLM class flavin-dependent oxidoreductase [Candidatus Saccharibacteria bacterium TM7i]|nr:LLM class flavin-dependent oxidoreductase [Candidatus Saccharibacteria bacterium TM7i]